MKKRVCLTALIVLTITVFALSPSVVFAGFNNRNGANGAHGTGKWSQPLPVPSNVPFPAGWLEELFGTILGVVIPSVVDGCRAYGGSTAVLLGDVNPFTTPPTPGPWVVEGKACCASHIEAGATDGETTYYEPNQCCNPPDLGGHLTPGNHCLCFVLTGYNVID